MIENIKKNWFLYIMGIIILFIIIKVVRDMRKPPPASNGGGDSTSTASGEIDYDKMLSVGSSGSEVVVLQNMLNANGQTLVTDGQFGTITLAALQAVTGLNEVTLNTFIATGSGIVSGDPTTGGLTQEQWDAMYSTLPWYVPTWMLP